MKTKHELLATIAGNSTQNIMNVMGKINKIWLTSDIHCKVLLLDIMRELIDKEEQRISKLGFLQRLLYNKQYADLELQYRSYNHEVVEQLQTLFDQRVARLDATKPVPLDPKAFVHEYDTALRSNSSLQEAFNLGLKGNMNKEVDSLKWSYAGLGPIRYYAMKAEQGMLFLEAIKSNRSRNLATLKEKNNLAQLCQHRNNFSNYSLLIHNKDNNLSGKTLDTVKLIQDNIDCLDNPDSSTVVSLQDGSTAFSIPGGWCDRAGRGHAINYEFKKQGNDYYFVIHNRKVLLEETQTRNLHGFVNFTNDLGKTYFKSRTVIKVPKDVIKNPAFIQALVTCTTSGDIGIYDYIHKALITDGTGEIVKSETELMLDALYEQFHSPFMYINCKEEIRQAALTLMKHDKSFHSMQLYGSCVESCITVFEKDVASSSVTKKQKKFTLDQIATRIQDKPEHAQNAPVIVNHVKEKIKTLSQEAHAAQVPLDLNSIQALINRNKDIIAENEKSWVYTLSPRGCITIPLMMKDSYNDVLTIVKNNGLALKNASASMRKDPDILRAAIKQNGLALQFAPRASRGDKTLVLEAIDNNPFALQFASPKLRADKEVLVKAMQKNYLAFHFIPKRLKRSPEFLLSLISDKKINPNILELFPVKFRQKKVFLLAALERDGNRFKFLPEKFKKDKAFFAAALKDFYYIFEQVPEPFKSDKKLILDALLRNRNRFNFIPEELKKDKAFLVELLNKDGHCYQNLPEAMKLDEDLIICAIKYRSTCFQYLPQELKTDAQFVLKIFREIVKFKDDEIRERSLTRYTVDAAFFGLTISKALALELVTNNGRVLLWGLPSSSKFDSDFDVVLAAVTQNGLALGGASDELRRNLIIIEAALKNNPEACKYVLPPKQAQEVKKADEIPAKSALISQGLFNTDQLEHKSNSPSNEPDSPDMVLK